MASPISQQRRHNIEARARMEGQNTQLSRGSYEERKRKGERHENREEKTMVQERTKSYENEREKGSNALKGVISCFSIKTNILIFIFICF